MAKFQYRAMIEMKRLKYSTFALDTDLNISVLCLIACAARRKNYILSRTFYKALHDAALVILTCTVFKISQVRYFCSAICISRHETSHKIAL